MTSVFTQACALVAYASYAHAQFGGHNGGSGNPYSNGGDGGYGPPGSSSGGAGNPFSNGFGGLFFSQHAVLITAHAVLATLAFGLLFPVGGIIIRLASWRGLWWIHGLFQIFAYILYIAAFAIGVYIAVNMRMLDEAHPIIGIVLFVLLFFQPILGFLHHTMFKKHSRRMVWSYGHIWLGRIIITLGIINGGLGLQLAQRTRFFAPPMSAIIAYAVVAGIIWLIYVAVAIYGESKRKQTRGSTSAKGNVNHPPSRRHRRRSSRHRQEMRGGRYDDNPPQYA